MIISKEAKELTTEIMKMIEAATPPDKTRIYTPEREALHQICQQYMGKAKASSGTPEDAAKLIGDRALILVENGGGIVAPDTEDAIREAIIEDVQAVLNLVGYSDDKKRMDKLIRLHDIMPYRNRQAFFLRLATARDLSDFRQTVDSIPDKS